MKKFLLIFLFITSYGFAQNSGITYQAVIYNPNGEELPGVNNPYAALTEQSVCLQFGIVDASGTIEYQENIQVTTDVFGMVNLLIGTYPQTSGYAASFSDINWGADAKFLKVDIDINGDCTNFKELSNQPFTYVPFAYYSPASDTPGPAGEDGNGIVNTINNTDNTITFEYTDGTSFTTDSLTGEDGGSGLSAYEVWIGLGNTGTEQEFIDSLNGLDGGSGLSAYEVWIGLGNTGTEQEFIDSLNGLDGSAGLKSLIITTNEASGSNCEKGGVKIEVGIDLNADGVLNDTEIVTSQTRYICNGTDGTDGVDGFNSNSGLGGGADTDTGFYLEYDDEYANGQPARLSGDGNIVTFSPVSYNLITSTDRALIYSLADGTLQPLTSIIYPSESYWNLTAFNYDGSIAMITEAINKETYFYQYNDNNNSYELLESSSEYLVPIDWSTNFEKILAYDANDSGGSTGSKVWSKNGNEWVIEADYPVNGVLGSGVYPKFNNSFTVSVTNEYGDFNGFSGNGKVTVYDYNNGVFTQKGNTIFGETNGANIGDHFDLSESGDRFTVVSSNTPYSNYKSIAVYDYDNLNNVWNKKGQNISLVGTGGGSTRTGDIKSVYLSENGQILTSVTATNDGTNIGKVVRYRLFNDIWIQNGSVTNVSPTFFYGTRYTRFKSKTFVQYLQAGQGFFIKIFD